MMEMKDILDTITPIAWVMICYKTVSGRTVRNLYLDGERSEILKKYADSKVTNMILFGSDDLATADSIKIEIA